MDISDELVERMVKLVRAMATPRFGSAATDYSEAHAIAAELPKPVDPDEAEAKAIIDAHWRETSAYIALMGIKRGRQLAQANPHD